MKKYQLLLICTFIILIVNPVLISAAVIDVSMTGFAFQPKTVTINPGDTVRWTNNASIQHTSTSGTGCTPDGIWDSGALSHAETFSYQFASEGTYPYFCKLHCALGMTGTVIVSSGTSTTTAPNSSTTTSSSPPCAAEVIYGRRSEETDLLKYYRDNVLSQTPEGRELIKLYYVWSPTIVRAMVQDEEFKEEVKQMIDSVLPLIREDM